MGCINTNMILVLKWNSDFPFKKCVVTFQECIYTKIFTHISAAVKVWTVPHLSFIIYYNSTWSFLYPMEKVYACQVTI